MEVLHVECLHPAARSSRGNRSVLVGTGQDAKAILSGHRDGISFDPVERTVGDDTDREKAKVKQGADRQDDLPSDRAGFAISTTMRRAEHGQFESGAYGASLARGEGGARSHHDRRPVSWQSPGRNWRARLPAAPSV